MRLEIRAKPGSRRESVTVGADAAGERLLIVRVRARAVDGAANRAVESAVAAALQLRRKDVALVRGTRSRVKLLEVTGDDDVLESRLSALPAEIGDQ